MLYRLDRTTQNIRVKQVTSLDVVYSDLSTPRVVRKVRKAELWKVVYGNGTSDVFNEPKATKPTAGSTASTAKPIATTASAVPATPPPVASPVAQIIPPKQPVSISNFSAGRQALSFGLDLSGSTSTVKNSNKLATTTTTTTSSNLVLTAVYQQFKRDNVSLGGGLRAGFTTGKSSSDETQTTPYLALSGQTRRYLPIASNAAFYGFSSVELGLLWYKYSYKGQSETLGTQQQVSVEAGAGLAYLFNSRWSVDFNASLLGLSVNRIKAASPTSKSAVDLSITGNGIVPGLSLYLTRYF